MRRHSDPSERWRFAAVAYALGMVLAGANLPTSLWPTYERLDRFGAGTLTAVFVVYVVAVAAALALAGQLSDRLGRRRVLLPALGLAVVGGAIFAASASVPALVAGRALSGVASGVLTSVAPATLIELDPAGDTGRASVTASAVTVFGLAAGPLVSAATVRAGPAPTRTVYLVYVAALLPALFALLRWHEERPAAAVTALRAPAVPRRLRALFARTAAQFSAGWTATAMFFALGPTLAARVLGRPDVLLAAVGLFAVFAVSGTAQLATRRRSIAGWDRLGLVLLVLGMTSLPVGLDLGRGSLMLAGALLAGGGQGLTHRASQQELLAASPPSQRGELAAAYYLVGYSVIAVLLLMLGQLVQRVGLAFGLAAFVAVIDLAALGSLFGARRSR